MAETGWFLMNSAIQATQSVVGTLAGEEQPKNSNLPPIDGPPNLTDPAADFGNPLAGISLATPIKPENLVDACRNVFDAALQSFGNLDRSRVRQWMALPAQLPLSIGSLMALYGLRGLHGAYTVGIENLPALFAYAVEVWVDAEIYTTLQYKEHVAHLAEQVRLHPTDARLRLLLGHTYIKLGRFSDAHRELAEAAKNQQVRPTALFESLIANYYAANYSQAIADGAASLSLKESDKTRFWLWLAAEKAGGYPAEVPQALRMEMKVGRHPTKTPLENIAQQIGLDKTGAGRGTAVFDFDGDGKLDVVVASNHAGMSLYRNNGDGTFTDVSVGSGLEY